MMHLDDAAIVMCLCGEQTITIAIKAFSFYNAKGIVILEPCTISQLRFLVLDNIYSYKFLE